MIWKVYAYINYLLTGKNRHGVHSPFVYSFSDRCLTQKIPSSLLLSYDKYYQQLRSNTNTIQVNDMGAGSKRLKNERKIADIARISGTTKKYGKLLYKITSYYQPKQVLELGTSLGLGTFMLAKGAKHATITSIDACPSTQEIAKKQFLNHQIDTAQLITSTFIDFLEKDHTVYDLIFIDGDHRGNKLIKLLSLLEKNSHDETLFILDDIRWTKDMYTAWKEITNHPNYHLTIDLFRMGIIAKRHHQQKQHFTIKL